MMIGSEYDSEFFNLCVLSLVHVFLFMPREDQILFQYIDKTVTYHFLQKCMNLMFLLCTYYRSSVVYDLIDMKGFGSCEL